MNTIFERILRGTNGNIELRRMVWNPNARKGEGAYGSPIERLFSRDLQDIRRFLSNGVGDVFHGINTRNPGASSGKKEDIYEVVCVAVDVDFKITPQEVFERVLNEFPLKPTFIVDSGNGRHLYWFFKTPILVNGDARKS